MNSRITTASRFRGQLMRAALLAAVALFATLGAHAQAAPAAGSATTGKTGVINIRQAIATTAEGKQASAELQSQFSARQSELEGMNKQINDIRQRLDTSAGKLSQDEATRLQRQGESMARQLQRKQDEYQEDVQSAQADVFDRIGRKPMITLTYGGIDSAYTWYNNAEMLKLTKDAELTVSPTARNGIYAKIQDMAAEQCPLVVLYYAPYAYAQQQTVNGFFVPPTGNYHLEDVTLS